MAAEYRTGSGRDALTAITELAIFAYDQNIPPQNIPLMFVTGYGRESLPTECGTVKILGKPFTGTQLLYAAMRIVEPHAQKGMDAAF
jgi:hypothetical protein